MELELVREAVSDSKNCIGLGADSAVYVFCNLDGVKYVAKKYRREVGPKISLYFEITNETARRAEEEKMQWNFGKDIGLLRVQVNPFQGLYDVNGFYIGVAKFVDGKTLSSLWEKESLYDAFYTGLESLTRYLNQSLGTRGIGLGCENVKLVGDGKSVINITDLCNCIELLRRGSFAPRPSSRKSGGTIK